MHNSDIPENNEKDRICTLFCQLNEFDNKIGRWYERSRWVKFEEVVENTKEHWSKPHVGILSLKSIFDLKEMMTNSVVSLSLVADNLETILDSILTLAFESGHIEETQIDDLKEILYMNHYNPHYNKGSMGSQHSLLRNFIEHHDKKSKINLNQLHSPEDPNNEEENLLEYKFCSRFVKKIPVGSEVANILVAETPILAENLCLFIRLSQSFIIGAYSEVFLPTRFITFLLGPQGNLNSLRECGRVTGSLFADNVFRHMAYTASSAEDLLQGIDEFTQSALVIPPDEWNPEVKIDPPKETIPERQSQYRDMNLNDDDDISKNYQPTEDDVDTELKRTGRIFGGFIEDIKRKKKFYISDFKDSLHIQCLASFIFLYFACLAPTITFGGLLIKATDGYLGAMESILGSVIVGTLYSLFAGQPLTILGTTGPLLIFEQIIFKICVWKEWDFLSFRLWIGIWIMTILIIAVALDLSYLVKYLTKFTEETFAMLISLIYIVKAFQKLFELLEDFPVNRNWNPNYVLNRTCICVPPNNTVLANINEGHIQRLLKFETPPLLPGFGNSTNGSIWQYIDWNNISDGYFSWNTHDYKKLCVDYGGSWFGNTCGKLFIPDIFYFSWLLMLGTFSVAYGLKLFRNSDWLPCKVREILCTFSVVIAIIIFTLVDLLIGMHTPKLVVPTTFQPSLGYSIRSWIVPILGKNPWWSTLLAFVPAILAIILIFMDQQITVIIVNRKSNKLKKGFGYHLDLFIIAILIGLCSLMGLPWFVGSTVLAMNHVMSLKIESSNNVPGVAPVFLGCREQRGTHLAISIAVGLSVFFTPMLMRIPMPVLYGVFFYMGVSPLSEIEMIQRIGLFFINVKKRPDYKYLQYIPIKRVHIFTLIQVICLVLLFTIKSINILSVSFPILVLAMCFVRKSLECCFSRNELQWLDNVFPEKDSNQKSSKSCSMCCKKKFSCKHLEVISNISLTHQQIRKDVMSLEDKIKLLNKIRECILQIRHRKIFELIYIPKNTIGKLLPKENLMYEELQNESKNENFA